MRFFVVDFATDVPSPLQELLEGKIRQILNEPTKETLLVKVARFPSSQLRGVRADFACRVTVCGVLGVPLVDEAEFILYRRPVTPTELGYHKIAK